MDFLKTTCIVMVAIFANTAIAQGINLSAGNKALDTSDQGSGISFIKPPEGFGLNRLHLKTEVLSLIDDAEILTVLEGANVEIASNGRSGNTYQINASASPLALVGDTADSVAKRGLPTVIDMINADIVATLSKPWNTISARNGTLRLTKLSLKDTQIEWAGVSLSGVGDIEVDENGLVTGVIKVTATPWQDLLEISTLNEAQRSTLSAMLGALSEGDSLTMPVTFDKGNLLVGPLVLAQIPPLVLPK